MKTDTAQRDTLPEDFGTIEEFWEFWDTHSSADYEDVMETVEAEIDLSSSKMYLPYQRACCLRYERERAGKAYLQRP